MATEQDSNQQELDPKGNPVQVKKEESAKADNPQEDYKQRYAALKTDYDKLVSKQPAKEEPKAPVTDSYAEWLLMNADRVRQVKPQYDELRASGVTPEKALEFAEKMKGKSSSSAADREASIPSPGETIDRGGSVSDVELTEWDTMLGVKPETKKKYQSFVEGR